jgi:hypothetical protein
MSQQGRNALEDLGLTDVDRTDSHELTAVYVEAEMAS